MRFLIDECVSPRVGALLAEAGHDAVHLRDLGLLGATDEAVMASAAAESRVLVSADTDFGELLATSAAELPSVILLRQSDRTVAHQASSIPRESRAGRRRLGFRGRGHARRRPGPGSAPAHPLKSVWW